MRPSTRVSTLAASILLAVLFPASARATSPTRVFLGLNGNNANDCSNPATPCFSFAGALAQVATGGEVIIEATGGYGPLDITKSVSINAAAGVVAFSAYTVTVNAPGATVALRGLTIDGTGIVANNGISVFSVGALHIESCVIANFTGNGIIVFSPSFLFINDTVVRGNGEFGIWIKPSSGVAQMIMDHCHIEANQLGIYCEPAVATVKDSILSGHTNTAASTFGSTAELNLERCIVANNVYGLLADTSSILRVSNTSVTHNGIGLSILNSGSLLSRSNNTVEGNTTNGSFNGTYGAK